MTIRPASDLPIFGWEEGKGSANFFSLPFLIWLQPLKLVSSGHYFLVDYHPLLHIAPHTPGHNS